MAWILAIGILVFLWIKFPLFRWFAVGIGILLGIIIGVLYGWDKYQTNHSKNLISVDKIELTDLTLGQSYSSYKLNGKVKNNSEHTLTAMTLEVRAYDCPTDLITPQCEVIGQDNVYVSTNVPSNQVRAINDEYVSLYNMPTVKGKFVWSYDISEIIGK